jgi:hypothetical protein
MKVKNNLRKSLIKYIVMESWSLFGSPFGYSKNVYAFNPEMAVQRYLKKSNRHSEIETWRPDSNRQWAKWRIVPSDKPFERFAVYFR